MDTGISRMKLSRWILVFLPVSITLLVVVALCVRLNGWEHERARLRFENDAASLAHQLEKNINGHLESLHAIKSFYASSTYVEREEFHTFVTRHLVRHPGIRALEWIPRVRNTERTTYEATARQDGYPHFQITQQTQQGTMVKATPRDQYFPVYYVQPYKGNEIAFGFDLGSNLTRRDALNKSRDTGTAIATARITLVQETNKQFGFIVFMPIYNNGLPQETIKQRRQNLNGFAAGVFSIDDIVNIVTRSAPKDHIELEIYDERAPRDQRWLYSDRAKLLVENDSFYNNRQRENIRAFEWTTTIRIADRAWSLRFSPSPEYLATHRLWSAQLVLIGGLLFTGLLAALLLSLTGHAARIRKLVSKRTSELAQANMQLKTHTHELELSNRELENFARVASHDLQEPLRKVQMFGDRLKEKYGKGLNEQGRDYIERMQNATNRMQTLISDLLAFSRVTSKGKPVRPVNLTEVAKNVLSDLEVRIEQTGGTVEIGDLPTIQADPTQMRQLLQNLIGNALKFHKPETPPMVRVTGKICPKEKPDDAADTNHQSVCNLTIEDNGIGFEEKFHDRIFAIFQRLHGRAEYEGTGIGLAICRKIAERHGGDINATSEPGRGAKFVVAIPIQQSTQGQVEWERREALLHC